MIQLIGYWIKAEIIKIAQKKIFLKSNLKIKIKWFWYPK